MVLNVNVDGSKWNDEDIVISGISARLPNCDSVEEFQTKLLDKVDLITDEPRRFQNGLYGAINRYGLLKDLSKFDAKFFNIHPKQAERMDPQIRNLLEVAYEATVDAGLHPEDLKGTRTGIVVGVASSETQDKWSQMPERINGYEYIGCTRTMFANRVSYYLDLKGPSYSIDTASSTTLVAFQQAYDMIKDGVCDACFVCGTDLVMNPCVCLMFQCLNMLSPEGKCKAFDIGGDGYVRSEGVVAVLLQRAKNAKRVYANVLSAGSNCDGYKDEGITFPSGAQQVKLFRRVAQLANIDPSTIDFMEAHGSATRVGDPQEMNAVTEVFTTGRKGPLRTGSIKSNMGHGEPASALSAVIKICVAMECGIIPPNLHYHTPNPDIPALLDGRLNVITEPTPWDGGLVAVNSFGVGGANGHALLLSNKKIKQNNAPDPIPRLVCVSGVTQHAVETMLNKIQSLPKDPELYALLHNIHRKNIKGHEYRGFVVENEKRIEKVTKRQKNNFSVVLPGIETKWKNVDQSLLSASIFETSIKNCEKELKSVSKSINLTNILKTLGQEKSPLNFVIGVTALQIGLIDTLNTLDLVPDFIVGLNIGEIAAGYADKKYTLSQAILSAYHVGNILQRSYSPSAVVETDMPRRFNFPTGVSVCNKMSRNCSHLVGPTKSIKDFSQLAKEKGYRVTELECFAIDLQGILQDSTNVSKLKTDLEKVLGKSMNASKKWLTSEVQSSKTSRSSGEFLIESLIRSSPIQDALKKCEESIYLQVGFGNSLKTLAADSFSFFDENAKISHLLSAVGELYNAGLQPQVQNLYSKVQFPVSHGTPMIQSMIEWDHSEKWNVVSFAPKDGRIAGEFDVVVDFDKEEFCYLPKNLLNKLEVFPKSFYIYLLWKTISRFQNKPMADIPLVIENMFFLQEKFIPEDGPVKFTINIVETSGKFEIRESGNVIASGHVQIPANVKKEQIPTNLFETADFQNNSEDLTKNDIYRNLSVKQYQYNETFKPMQASNISNNIFKAKISNNWCSLFEAFLQISIFCSSFEENCHMVVSYIRKIIIDPSKFEQDQIAAIKYHKKWNVLKSALVEMRGIKLNEKPSVMSDEPIIRSDNFVPFNSQLDNAAEASLMLALENWIGQTNLKIAEIIDKPPENLLSTKIQNVNPLIKIDIVAYSKDSTYTSERTPENVKIVNKDILVEPVDNNCHIITASSALGNQAVLDNIVASIRTDGCILLEEDFEEHFNSFENLECLSTLSSENKIYFLLKKINRKTQNLPRVITVTSLSDCIQKLNQIPDGNTLIVARDNDVGGIAKYVKNLMATEPDQSLKAIFIEDETAPLFTLANKFYTAQLKKNYPFNVYKNGAWGAYIPLSLPKDTFVPVQEAFIGVDYNQGEAEIDLVASNAAIYRQLKNPWEVTCSVNYASINGREYAFYHGVLCPKFSLADADCQKYQLGVEFSGYEGSRRVFGLVAGGALSTSVIADKDFLWNVPKNWSLEDACSVPGPYSVAFYAFGVLANLKTEDSVLIIGDNSVSMASIQIALARNANVFIMVQETIKKLELAKYFPQVKSNQILVSKNDNFSLQVLQNTAGKGVNYLFVTIPVETFKFQSYVNSLAENGKCFYFNREQRSHEELLGSSGNMRCISFYRITPSSMFINSSIGLKKKISELMNDGLKTGAIKPLPHTVLTLENLKQGFNQDGENNTSKILVEINEENSKPKARKMYIAKARAYFDSQKYYIILGGLEDFGAYVTDWMVKQGAKNLVFVQAESESENQALFKSLCEKWKLTNCSVSIAKVNDFSQTNCESIAQKVLKLGPFGGVFDFTQFKSNKIEDSAEDKNTINTYLARKLDFLTNMDTITRKLSLTLEFFVSLSTVEFEYASSNQSLFCFVNGKLQSLIRNRVESNLSAKYIQWGPIGESMSEILYNSSITELRPQSLNSSLKRLHTLLTCPQPVVSSFITSTQSTESGESKVDVIMEGVAKFLGIKDPSTVLPSLTMLELGLDSLIGTDIQQFLEINYGVILSTQEVRELTFDKLRTLAESL